MNLLENFKLSDEKEKFDTISENIENGVDFSGTNLWILIFAIFIASLGLNVNSTAVIIGAMLVSPLMGPIMGLGFGMATNDIELLKRSLFSYLFAAGVALATSTVFFFLSPINDAHSEILARTSPNIYDVLIAFFGGLAGILATSSKLKGNVIPGVAIATALMPPLCTAGYGLATLQFSFFFGAFYLFLINTVFIALATLITSRLLNFPIKHLENKEYETRAKRTMWIVVTLTLVPSLYFGYDIVQQNKFSKNANRFVDVEANFTNDYLLKKEIDAKAKTIILTYGGQRIEDAEIEKLKSKLVGYGLQKTTLDIRQGFAYLEAEKNNTNDQTLQLTIALHEKEKQVEDLQKEIDSLLLPNQKSKQILNELQSLYPTIESFAMQNVKSFSDSTEKEVFIAIIHTKHQLNITEKEKIEKWLAVRMETERPKIYFE